MSTITDPNIFAGRLSRDCMNGWVVFLSGPRQDDVVVRLGRYPVTHNGDGRMNLKIDLPDDFAPIDCYRVKILSRKMRPLCEFSFKGAVTKEAKLIRWQP